MDIFDKTKNHSGLIHLLRQSFTFNIGVVHSAILNFHGSSIACGLAQINSSIFLQNSFYSTCMCGVNIGLH